MSSSRHAASEWRSAKTLGPSRDQTLPERRRQEWRVDDGQVLVHGAQQRHQVEDVAGVSPVGERHLGQLVDTRLRRLELWRSKKRALVFISDGGDNASINTHAPMVAAARETDAAIYVIGIVSRPVRY